MELVIEGPWPRMVAAGITIGVSNKPIATPSIPQAMVTTNSAKGMVKSNGKPVGIRLNASTSINMPSEAVRRRQLPRMAAFSAVASNTITGVKITKDRAVGMNQACQLAQNNEALQRG